MTIIKNLAFEQALAEKRIEIYQQWFIDNQVDTYGKVFGNIIANYKDTNQRLPGIHYVNWK